MISVITRLTSRIDRSVTEPLFVFGLSRILIFAIAFLASQVSLNPPEIGLEPHQLPGRNAVIALNEARNTQTLRQTIAQGDVNFYLKLSELGYDRQPFGTDRVGSSLYASFPLLPALLWLLGKIGFDKLIAGTVLSNILFLAALVVLYKLARKLNYDEPASARTIFYLAVFPASHFLSLPMTESLFLFLTVVSFYAAVDRKWLTAGVFGALASATRLSGILLVPALVVLLWQRREKLSMRSVLGLSLLPLGLLGYMVFSWWRTGDAIAFVHGQNMFGRRLGWFVLPLFEYFRQPSLIALPWNFLLLNILVALLAFFCVYLLIKQRQMALACYVLLSILLPLSTLTLISIPRYMSVCFPMFIALSVPGQSLRVDQTIRAIFIALLALMSALFATRFTLALT